MSAFGKLKFWKKEDEFDFDQNPLPEPAGEEPGKSSQWPLDEKSPFPEEPALPLGKTSASSYTSPNRGRDPDLELINSKLDTLKAMLSALEQRLATLEKSLESNKKERLW